MFTKTLCAAALGAAALCAHAGNPIVKDRFTADPTAMVDNGRVYLYAGIDEAPPEGKDYLMNEWRVYSTCDMVHWTDHGLPLNVKAFKWAKADAWAADVVKHNGKYWFYAPVEHATVHGKAIGVAVSDSPTGPFVDARGSALITNDMTPQTEIWWDDIDPSVFIDAKGQPWIYWGNMVLKYAKLKQNMIELDSPIYTVTNLESFTEAPYVHRRGDTYYLSYSRYFPEEMVYATSKNPNGPWTFRGKIMDKNTHVKTIHQAIVDFNGKSYVFYHNTALPTGAEFRRSVGVEELHYNQDGSIQFVPQSAEGPKANPSQACK